MADPRSQVITDAYPRAAAELLRPLIELMSAARRHCGDIDSFLIILAVAVRTGAHPEFRKMSQASLSTGEIAVLPSLGTNVRSIAASVGIPKETVRRKVAELEAAGWLVRAGRDIRVTAQAYRALAPVRTAIERLALRHADVVGALLADRG